MHKTPRTWFVLNSLDKTVMGTKHFFAIILITATIVSATAQNGVIIPANYSLSNIGNRQGLATQVVNKVYQDDAGFVWLATWNNLTRYDAYHLVEYRCNNSSDSVSMPDLSIVDIAPRDKASMWVATDDGLFIFDTSIERFEKVEHIGNLKISKITLDKRDGSIWLQTPDTTLRYNPAKNAIERSATAVAISAERMVRIMDDVRIKGEHSNYFIVGASGEYIMIYDRATNAVLSHALSAKNPLGSNMITDFALHHASADTIYIGTDKGLMLWQPLIGSFRSMVSGEWIKSIVYDKQNNLWVGGWNGLHLFSPDGASRTLRHESNNQSTLPSSKISHLLIDRENNLWVATVNGLSRISLTNAFRSIKLHEITPHTWGNQIFRIQNGSGNIFLLGNNGLIIYNTLSRSSRWLSTYSAPHLKLSNNMVRNVFQDPKRSMIWIATDRGLNSYDMTTDRTRSYDIASVGDYSPKWIYNIAAREGYDKLFLSTYKNGLFVVSIDELLASTAGRKIEPLLHFSTSGLTARAPAPNDPTAVLPHDVVNRSVIVDSTSSLSSLMHQGVVLIERNKAGKYSVTHFHTAKQNIPTNTVNRIVKNSAGEIFALGDKQLMRYNKLKKSFDLLEIDGLDEPIHNICVGGGNSVWLDCPSGLKLYSALNGALSSHGKITLDEGATNDISYDSVSNRVYYASDDEFGYLDIDNFTRSVYEHKISITSLFVEQHHVKVGEKIDRHMVLDRSIEHTSRVELMPWQNSFTLEFSALIFTSEQNVTYKYRLKGLSDKWIKSFKDDNRATFVNVPYGDYTFQVVETNDSGHELSEIRSLEIKILPPWYLTNLAIVLYALLFVLLVVFVWWRIKIRFARRMERYKRAKSIHYSKMKYRFMSQVQEQIKDPLQVIIDNTPVSGNVSAQSEQDDSKQTAISSSVERLQKFSAELDSLITKGLQGSVGIRAEDQPSDTQNPIQSSITIKLRQDVVQGSVDSKFIEMMLNIVEQNIQDTELVPETLSRQSGISAKSIYVRIKKLTELTPTEFIRLVRLRKAALLLSSGRFSISEVIYMVGFTHNSYFTKCFKQEYNMTPRDFVKQSTSS